MAVEKIKYFITIFYPDEKGFYLLPEGSIAAQIVEDANRFLVKALVPIKE